MFGATAMQIQGWTDARVEILKTMWSNGASSGVIAQELGGGITRNAVIGKLHRLGLQRGKKAPLVSLVKRSPRRRLFPRPPKLENVPPVELADIPQEPPLNIPFFDISDDQCREIVGTADLGLACYCGHKVVPDTSWCPHHFVRNFRAVGAA